MLIKKYIGALVLGCAALPAMAGDITITPDVTTPIRLSNTDINRIVCVRGDIEDALYSKEKGLKISWEGKNAFVKYLIQVTPNGEKYVQNNTEIHIVCDSEVYTLVATPEQGGPQTIYLAASTRNRAEKNISMMGAMPMEQKVLMLIQAAYTDDTIPDTFSVTRFNKPVKADGSPPSSVENSKPLWEEVDITLARVIRVDGVGLSLKEYSVIARANVDLRETDFLRKEFGDAIAGITIDPPKLKAKEKGRLFIVDRETKQ